METLNEPEIDTPAIVANTVLWSPGPGGEAGIAVELPECEPEVWRLPHDCSMMFAGMPMRIRNLGYAPSKPEQLCGQVIIQHDSMSGSDTRIVPLTTHQEYVPDKNL